MNAFLDFVGDRPLAAHNAEFDMGFIAQAARRMGQGADAAGNALCLFLVMNASSVQLLPTTVIALRTAAGSANPAGIALPTLAATAVSTVVGVLCCKCAEKRR